MRSTSGKGGAVVEAIPLSFTFAGKHSVEDFLVLPKLQDRFFEGGKCIFTTKVREKALHSEIIPKTGLFWYASPMSKKRGKPADLEGLLESYRAFLSERQLKMTNQRKVIIAEFVKAGGHLSAEELFRLVKKKASGVGLASVYRTIGSLVEAGLAVERRFLDKTSVYELEEPGHHHDHLICMKCRKIFEFENPAIEEQQKKVAEDLGFSLKDHKLELYGWCNRSNCPNL